jgi:hypothetical protein
MPFDANTDLLFDELEALLVPAIVQDFNVDIGTEGDLESLGCVRQAGLIIGVEI